MLSKKGTGSPVADVRVLDSLICVLFWLNDCHPVCFKFDLARLTHRAWQSMTMSALSLKKILRVSGDFLTQCVYTYIFFLGGMCNVLKEYSQIPKRPGSLICFTPLTWWCVSGPQQRTKTTAAEGTATHEHLVWIPAESVNQQKQVWHLDIAMVRRGDFFVTAQFSQV